MLLELEALGFNLLYMGLLFPKAHGSPEAPNLTVSDGQNPSRGYTPFMVRRPWPSSALVFLAYSDPVTLAFSHCSLKSNSRKQVLMRMWKDWNPCTLLVTM